MVQRYERTADRLDTRVGFYEHNLDTTSGRVKRKMPKLRTIPFERAIGGGCKRREVSIEEALVEMFMAGVYVRRVEDIIEALRGTGSASARSAN